VTDSHAAIFTGGDPPHPAIRHVLATPSLIVAADGGFEHAVSTGHSPHVLIGDMDSVSARNLEEAEAFGIEIIRHPVDKDKTDTELALDLALERGKVMLTVVSGGGDRLDHILGFLHSVAPLASEEVHIELWIGTAHVDIVPAGSWREIVVGEQMLASLIPLGGPARGVTTERLKWELRGDTLEAHSSRGVSNVPLDHTFNVTLDEGVLAVIQPYFLNATALIPPTGGLN